MTVALKAPKSTIISILCTHTQYINLGTRLALSCHSSLFSTWNLVVHLWGDVRALPLSPRESRSSFAMGKTTLSTQVRHLDGPSWLLCSFYFLFFDTSQQLFKYFLLLSSHNLRRKSCLLCY